MSEAFDTTGRCPPEENERNLHGKGKGNSAANSGKQKKPDHTITGGGQRAHQLQSARW